MAIQPFPLVRIISDGTGPGTKVLDREGNEVLPGAIRAVRFEISPETKRVGRVTLELVPVAVELTGELAEVSADKWELPARV